MKKEGFKPSADPVQNALRTHKQEWNVLVSSFITNLIQYKKLLNGSPNKFIMEKTNIKNPLPAQATTVIGNLAELFVQIAEKAKLIAEEQAHYSETRRHSTREK